jgi:hypothetical protein
MMAMRLFVFLVVIAACVPEATAADAPALRRFALIAASNDGGKDRARLRFANSDAKAMASVLRDLGGVQREDLVLLTSARRASLQAAFATIRTSVAGASKSSPRSELFVYYSGHSDDQGLLLAGERVAYRELRRWVDRTGACSKGARPSEPRSTIAGRARPEAAALPPDPPRKRRVPRPPAAAAAGPLATTPWHAHRIRSTSYNPPPRPP